MDLHPRTKVPDLERTHEPPPSRQEVSAALLRCGCNSAIAWTEDVIVGVHEDGSRIKAERTRNGWLLTGGPLALLNYGVPGISALERFPSVLASIQEHARLLNRGVGA